VVVGVEVPDGATDLGQLRPMVEQLQRRYGRGPQEMLADGGYVAREDIRVLGGPGWGCHVYAPPAVSRGPGRTRDRRRRDDAVLAAWRARMQTDAAQAIYRERAATSECVNALARQRGLRQFLVRGLAKVRTVLLWFALAHNLLHAATLRRVAAAAVS
jgi:IS5 family transposase